MSPSSRPPLQMCVFQPPRALLPEAGVRLSQGSPRRVEHIYPVMLGFAAIVSRLFEDAPIDEYRLLVSGQDMTGDWRESPKARPRSGSCSTETTWKLKSVWTPLWKTCPVILHGENHTLYIPRSCHILGRIVNKVGLARRYHISSK